MVFGLLRTITNVSQEAGDVKTPMQLGKPNTINIHKQYIPQWPSRSDHSNHSKRKGVMIGFTAFVGLCNRVPDLQVAPKNRQSVLWLQIFNLGRERWGDGDQTLILRKPVYNILYNSGPSCFVQWECSAEPTLRGPKHDQIRYWYHYMLTLSSGGANHPGAGFQHAPEMEADRNCHHRSIQRGKRQCHLVKQRRLRNAQKLDFYMSLFVSCQSTHARIEVKYLTTLKKFIEPLYTGTPSTIIEPWTQIFLEASAALSHPSQSKKK